MKIMTALRFSRIAGNVNAQLAIWDRLARDRFAKTIPVIMAALVWSFQEAVISACVHLGSTDITASIVSKISLPQFVV